MKYRQLYDGEWFYPRRYKHRNACCDCGLVHEWTFKLEGRTIKMKASRNMRATAAKRRYLKHGK